MKQHIGTNRVPGPHEYDALDSLFVLQRCLQRCLLPAGRLRHSGAFGILVICRGDRSRDIDMSHVKHSFGDGPTVVSSAYQLYAASYCFRPKGFNAYTYPNRGPLDASVDGGARF